MKYNIPFRKLLSAQSKASQFCTNAVNNNSRHTSLERNPAVLSSLFRTLPVSTPSIPPHWQCPSHQLKSHGAFPEGLFPLLVMPPPKIQLPLSTTNSKCACKTIKDRPKASKNRAKMLRHLHTVPVFQSNKEKKVLRWSSSKKTDLISYFLTNS